MNYVVITALTFLIIMCIVMLFNIKPEDAPRKIKRNEYQG